MKIAIIGPAYPYRGGIATYNERLAEEFIAEGHQVKMYTFTVQYPNFLFPGKTQFTDKEKPQGLDIERCINSVNPFNWFSVGRKINKENFDLIVVKFWMPFFGASYGTILRQVKKKTKVVCIVDNIIPHEKRIGDMALTNYFTKTIDGFIVMSESVMRDMETLKIKKPKTLSLHPLYDNFGASIDRDEALKYLGLQSEYQYILFFGLIRDYKGLDLLYKAFADDRFRGKKIKLIVAGEYYNNREDYEKLIETLSLQDDVVVKAGFVADDDVRYYFSAANIIAQPYKSATQSGVTQIAYHFNKPMLVTNVGGLKELCPHGQVGYVCEPTPKAIADSLLKYFDDDKEEQFTTNILEEKKRFSWSTMTDRVRKIVRL